MIGQTFHDLTVISQKGRRITCRCSCGVVREFWMSQVIKGNNKSCGCRKERSAGKPRTHGAKCNGEVKPTYRSWQMMKNRCTNPRGQDYQYYGGRGISFDPAWQTYEGFVADMGEAPPGYTIERVDNDGDYNKENCVWATRQTQARNREYCTPHTYNGVTLQTWEWAEKLGIKYHTFAWRLWLHRKDPANYPLSVVFSPRGESRRVSALRRGKCV
jgi:hypothetical protein